MRNHKPLTMSVFFIAAFAFALMAKSITIRAQEVKEPPTIPLIRVYDTYPHPSTSGASRYALAERWGKTDLTYQFNNCPSLVECGQAQDTVRQAFSDWTAVSVLTFTEVSSGADMEIAWAGAEEGMGVDSDTLGFAYFPDSGGDMFLNDTIEWEFGTGTDNDLYLTAAHEIGHALGLDHSDDPASLMFPTATSQTTGIAEDDIQGIQALYGAEDGTAPIVDESTPEEVATDTDTTETVVETTDVQVINYSYLDLCELYVSSSDSEDWGDDWLEGEPLADNESILDDTLDEGSYDVLAIPCDGTDIEVYGLLISEGSSIEIYEDTVAVYP